VAGDQGKHPFAGAAGKILLLLLETIIAYNRSFLYGDLIGLFNPLLHQKSNC